MKNNRKKSSKPNKLLFLILIILIAIAFIFYYKLTSEISSLPEVSDSEQVSSEDVESE